MPHTKHQIKELLESHNLSPRRIWGQNFLIDLNLMRLLVDAVGLAGQELVLEVGCGTGSLTELLSDRAGEVMAVEIDKKLMEIAQEQLAQRENITFICSDILTTKNAIESRVREVIINMRRKFEAPFYLVANLPYQAAAPLMMDLLLEEGIQPDGMWITIQAEVAERMTARPGAKDYGILSILLQATGKIKHLRLIKPQAFWPQPKVNSAMVSWRRDADKCGKIASIHQLKKTAALLLNQRRKKIRNCLVKETGSNESIQVLERLGIDPDGRAENLEPEVFVQIANEMAKF